MARTYYTDTCIWLNLFKKEIGSDKEHPHWRSAKEFIEKIEENGEKIFVSTIVLKELYFVAKDKFNTIKEFLKDSNCVEIIKTNSQDYELARTWEELDHHLSFYDYLHVAIAKRMDADLITRDGDLLSFAKNHINAFKPEDLVS